MAVSLIGVAITLPTIIYTTFIRRVLWGKATALSYGMTPKGCSARMRLSCASPVQGARAKVQEVVFEP